MSAHCVLNFLSLVLCIHAAENDSHTEAFVGLVDNALLISPPAGGKILLASTDVLAELSATRSNLASTAARANKTEADLSTALSQLAATRSELSSAASQAIKTEVDLSILASYVFQMLNSTTTTTGG